MRQTVDEEEDGSEVEIAVVIYDDSGDNDLFCKQSIVGSKST